MSSTVSARSRSPERDELFPSEPSSEASEGVRLHVVRSEIEPIGGLNASRADTTVIASLQGHLRDEDVSVSDEKVGIPETDLDPIKPRRWWLASGASFLMHAALAGALLYVIPTPPELKIAKGDSPGEMKVSFIELPKKEPAPEPPAAAPTPPAPPVPEPPKLEPPKPVEPPKPIEPPKPVVEKPKPKPKPKPVEHTQQKPLPVKKKPEPQPEPAPSIAQTAATAAAATPAPAASASVQAPVAKAGAKTAVGSAGLPTGSIDDSDIRPLRMDPPQYPDMLRRRGLSGEVKVMFTVTADGRIDDVEVLDSSNRQFERVVLEALKTWRFAPRVSGGQIVPRKATKTFIFKLQRR